MVRNRARSLIIALSLFAAVGGSMLPGSHAASAAPIPAAESITNGQWDLVEQVKPKPKPTWVVQQPPVTYTALLRVKHELTTQLPNGNGTTYVFTVFNDGLNSSGPITVEKGWWWSAGLGEPITGHTLLPETIPSLGPGQSTTVGMFCHEEGFTVCWGGGVRVSAPNDNSPSNNFANSGNAYFN